MHFIILKLNVHKIKLNIDNSICCDKVKVATHFNNFLVI